MRRLSITLCTVLLCGTPRAVHASLIGNGLNSVGANSGIPTAVNNTTLRPFIENSLQYIINFLALIATATIVVAGIFLIAGFGTDTSKERAKKIVIYTIVGLLVVYFAKMVVSFINSWPS